jgi:hypothetical protein
MGAAVGLSIHHGNTSQPLHEPLPQSGFDRRCGMPFQEVISENCAVWHIKVVRQLPCTVLYVRPLQGRGAFRRGGLPAALGSCALLGEFGKEDFRR